MLDVWFGRSELEEQQEQQWLLPLQRAARVEFWEWNPHIQL